ncbi:MAG: hypothetical protein FWC08_12110, partial [Defluviitaleaceae bacterium]|nr:hypothetical protein [Defluviitaleaceae bacterium]
MAQQSPTIHTPPSGATHNRRTNTGIPMRITVVFNGWIDRTLVVGVFNHSGTPLRSGFTGWMQNDSNALINGNTFEFTIPANEIIGIGIIRISAFAWSGTLSDIPFTPPAMSTSSTVHRDITVTTNPPLAPINLSPRGTSQNRNNPITISWEHNPRPASETGGVVDPQLWSLLQFWQTGSTETTNVNIQGTTNSFTIPAETFITEASVNFNVRTYGGNGAG